jgi:hypothetical protein
VGSPLLGETRAILITCMTLYTARLRKLSAAVSNCQLAAKLFSKSASQAFSWIRILNRMVSGASANNSISPASLPSA